MALEWIDKIDGVDENSAGDVNSLAAAIKDNETAIAGKVDKASGKGLSSNDYTDAEKTKLSGIEPEANKYVHPDTHPASMITGLGDAASKNTGTAAGTVAAGDHDHNGVYDPAGSAATAQTDLNAHKNNSDIHVTTADKTAWNSKADGNHNHDGTYQPVGNYLTSESDPTVPAWAKQSNKPSYNAAEVGADPEGSAAGVQGNLNAHEGNTTVHVTSAEKAKWDGKISPSNIKAGANVTVTTSGNDVTISSAGGGEPAPLINNLTTATAGQGALDAAQGKILNDSKADINHNHQGIYQPVGNYLTSEVDPTVPAWAKAASKPTYTSAEVGAVPTTRKVNGKALSADITLSAADVGADASGAADTVQTNLTNHTNDTVKHITAAERTAWNSKAAGNHTHTPTSIGAAPAYTYGTTDMTAGTTALATGTLYLMYE